MVTRPRVTGSSVSGTRILLIAMEAGILMTEDVTRFAAGTPRLIYAARTDPAIVEKPDVIVRSSLMSALCREKGSREKHTKFGFRHHLRYLGLECGTKDTNINSRSTYGRTRHADSPIDMGGNSIHKLLPVQIK